jgi:tetratricopeptide (TPR) repeat protein
MLAHVIAAATCSYMECIDHDEGVPLMQWAANRAVELDPGRADASLFAQLGDLRRVDKTDLLGSVRRALTSMPQDAVLHHWAAAILLSGGKPGEAMLHMRVAIGLQPSVLTFRTFAAAALLYAGRSDEAIRHLGDILECDPEDYAANYWLSRAFCARGGYDEAREVADRAHAASGTAKSLSNLGNVEAFIGNKAAVKNIVGKLEQKRANNEYVPRSGLVAIHIASGKLDAAAMEAEAAARDGDFRLAWISGDPLWAPLRGKVAGV